MHPLTKQGLDRYANERIPTGGFLRAVLENDLRGACERADDENAHDLYEIVRYCYNRIPAVCWGSPESVKKWLERKG
jgi:hypothetical protein